MVYQGTRARVFQRLLTSLGSAERGNREFDIIISFVLGDTSGDAGRMIELLVEEGYSWDIISELLDEDLPPYTQSLDAAIPGEDIVISAYSAKRGRWASAQRGPGGQHVMAWAANECLARRAAALRALYAGLVAAEPPAGEEPAGATAETVEEEPAPPAEAAIEEAAEAAPGERPTAGEETESDWKILF